MMKIAMLIASAALLASCAATPGAAPAVLSELAPGGMLRAAIHFGNPTLAVRDPVSGAPRGVSVDLSRELGRRLAVPVELVTFDAAGKVLQALQSKAVDIGFVAIDPARAIDVAYSGAYLVIEGAYLVQRGSPIHSNSEVDRPGVRVAVAPPTAL